MGGTNRNPEDPSISLKWSQGILMFNRLMETSQERGIDLCGNLNILQALGPIHQANIDTPNGRAIIIPGSWMYSLLGSLCSLHVHLKNIKICTPWISLHFVVVFCFDRLKCPGDSVD